MSASITTFDLGWSTPEGQLIFANINLSFNDERVGIVGRNGVGKTSLLKLLAGELEPGAGKIAVRGKVCMLRQIVQVRPDDNIAGLFGLTGALDLLRKAAEGLATMDELAEADWTLESRIALAFAHVGLNATPDTLLASLSGGQRTRAAMAGVLLEEPDFLLLDGPSNNLDRDRRQP